MSIALINEEHTALSVNFNNTSDEGKPCGDSADILNEVFTGPDANPPAGVTSVTVTGLSLLGPIMDDALDQSRAAIMSLGIGLILALLLVLFKFRILRVIAAAFPVLLVLGGRRSTWLSWISRSTCLQRSYLLSLWPSESSSPYCC